MTVVAGVALPVDWLARRMPRWAALLLVVATLAGGTATAGALAAPTLVEQAGQLRKEIPEAIGKGRRWLEGEPAGGGSTAERDAPTAKETAPGGQAAAGAGQGEGAVTLPEAVTQEAVPAVMAVAQGLTSIVLVLVLAVFLTASPRTYRVGIRQLLPDAWQGPYDETVARVGGALGGWLRGILVEMVINGALAGIGLWAIGFKQWFVMAVVTGLLAFVPYLGAVTSGVVAMLVALAQGPTMVLWTGLVFLAIHTTEGYLVTPMVMRRAVEVQPGLLLLGQGVMTAVFGLMGTIVATPLIVCAQVLVGYLWVERRLGRPAHP